MSHRDYTITRFPTDACIGLNRHGTACIHCPLCSNWYIASRFSWHVRIIHVNEFAAMKKQSRSRLK